MYYNNAKKIINYTLTILPTIHIINVQVYSKVYSLNSIQICNIVLSVLII